MKKYEDPMITQSQGYNFLRGHVLQSNLNIFSVVNLSIRIIKDRLLNLKVRILFREPSYH